MKKRHIILIISILLISTLLISLTACSGNTDDDKDKEPKIVEIPVPSGNDNLQSRWASVEKYVKGAWASENFSEGQMDIYDGVHPFNVIKIIPEEKILAFECKSFEHEMDNVKAFAKENNLTRIPDTDIYTTDAYSMLNFLTGDAKKIDDVWFSKNKTKIIRNNKNNDTYEIPSGVTEIGYAAFGDIYLKGIKFANGLKSIGEKAFYQADIEKIDIPDSVTSIGAEAFFKCERLSDVKLPANLEVISEGMFSGCGSLENIEIPNGVTKIGREAFFTCAKLLNLGEAPNVEYVGEWAFRGTKWLDEKTTTVYFGKVLYRYIPPESSSPEETFTIKDGIVYIAADAFRQGKPHEQEGSIIFVGGKALKEIIIPKSVTSIGEFAFAECYDLTDITIPKSIVEMEESIFYNCLSLTEITYNGTKAEFEKIENLSAKSWNDSSKITKVICIDGEIILD